MFEEIDAYMESTKDSRYSSIEQTMITMACSKLTAKQKKIWDFYNIDRLTQEEIGAILGIKQQTVDLQIRAIEKKIKQWCETNRGAYMLLKLEHKIMNEEIE